MKIGDKFILSSQNGHKYSMEIVNINEFREPSMKYGVDVYDENNNYAGDILFVGEDFFKKENCKRVN